MFGRKQNGDDKDNQSPQEKNPKEKRLSDRLRDEMDSSFDDMRSELDDYLAGRSEGRQGGAKPPEKVDYPWESDLNVDAEVGGAPRTPKGSSIYKDPDFKAEKVMGHGRRDPLLPPGWDRMTRTQQIFYLENLVAEGRVTLKEIIHLFPKQGDEPGYAAPMQEKPYPTRERKKPKLFSRASRTQKENSNTLTGTPYKEHMDGLKAHIKGDKEAFDPASEEAFNTDARNLREYDLQLKKLGNPKLPSYIEEEAKRNQLLKAYEEVGRRQDVSRNYPHVENSAYEQELQVLKEAYRKGHGKPKQSAVYSDGALENRPLPSHGSRHPLLPMNWESMPPIEQMFLLDRLIAQGRVQPQEVMHLYPDWDSIKPEEEPEEKRRLFSRASKTGKPTAPAASPVTLKGGAYKKHQDSLKAFVKGDKKKFNPKTQAAFNTDAMDLNEYNGTIVKFTDANGNVNTAASDAQRALERKEQLLDAYYHLGRQRKIKQNYPRNNRAPFKYQSALQELQCAYHNGHNDAIADEAEE